MYSRSLIHQIETLSEQASIEAGTSYEAYLQLFSDSFDKRVKRKTREAFHIAFEYGYVPKKER